MTGWIAAVIGIIIVVFSLNRIIHEIRRAGIPNMEDQAFSDTFYALLSRVERHDENLDDINQAFYEAIERLDRRIDALENQNGVNARTERMRKRRVSSAEESDPAPSQTTLPPTDLQSVSSEDDRLRADISRMIREGMDSQQIARELNLGVGEIELIRRLRGRDETRKVNR